MRSASNSSRFAMDESLQDLENELKRLQPRRTSEELRSRLERELGAPSVAGPVGLGAAPARPRYSAVTSLTSWKWFSWQMAAAAAVALTVSLAVWSSKREPVARPVTPETVVKSEPAKPAQTNRETDVAAVAPAVDSYRPVGAANVLYDLKEDGTVYLNDNTPAQRLRYRYVDTYTWKNPATHASLKWSVPRDEVRVIPASMH
jgi:hypothetical protein